MNSQLGGDRKQYNRSRIARYILSREQTSKPEIASALRISMPTVLQNIKELMDEGMIEEVGEYESTGGRKARALSFASGIRQAVGIDITANHISYVLIDVKGNVLARLRIRRGFEHSPAYYESVRTSMDAFLSGSCAEPEKILGVGISLPGIIDKASGTLVKSHILQVEQISLQMLGQFFDQEPAYENDANSAAMAEFGHQTENGIYLSLSNTVGGAIHMNGAIYSGDNFRSAEFGHMILAPGGEMCYCGKQGCVDAYCSARVLSSHTEDNLEEFFVKLEQKNPEIMAVWDTYLDHLAVAVANLRMAFDCNIILGGYVGAYLEKYRLELAGRVQQYNVFDRDSSYLNVCRYRKEASAVGIALTFVDKFIDRI